MREGGREGQEGGRESTILMADIQSLLVSTLHIYSTNNPINVFLRKVGHGVL